MSEDLTDWGLEENEALKQDTKSTEKVDGTELILRGKVNAALNTAKGFVIKTSADYQNALNLIKGWKKLKKEIKESFKNSVDKAKAAKQAATEAYKAVCEHEESFTAPIDEIVSDIDRKTVSWNANIQAIAAAEQRKKDEETARLNAEAQKAIESGNTEKAIELSTKAAEVACAAPVVSNIKVDGVYEVERWHYEVTDFNLVPREFLVPDHDKLQKKAVSEHGLIAIPGVRFYSTKSNASRG